MEKSPMAWSSGAVVVALAALTSACASAPQKPDLGGLYNQAAQRHHEYGNPVIVIPGILGTRLTDPASGRTVWGAFGGNAANPQKPDGAVLASLPMRSGASLAALTDGVEPDGVLDKLDIKLAGLPFQLKAYFQILLTLGAGGYYDETAYKKDVDYGSEHFTCFQFDYDWRRDNVENARRLHRFMLEKRAYVAEQKRKLYGEENPDIKFDVIAHSMGGLVLRYLLRYGTGDLPADGSLPELTWAGSELIDRAILVATPSAGAVDALVQLVEGRKFGPFTPHYEAALLGSFPSIYQLLPRPRHGALVEADDRHQKVDFMAPEFWREMGWGLASPAQDPVLQLMLPEVADSAERREIALEHQRKSLVRAKQFHAALDRPASPPAGTSLHLFAGDAVATDKIATVDRASKKLTVVTQAPGDGTVLRSSALMDERLGQEWRPRLDSAVDWTSVSFLFADHLGMTSAHAFSDNVLYLLLEAPR